MMKFSLYIVISVLTFNSSAQTIIPNFGSRSDTLDANKFIVPQNIIKKKEVYRKNILKMNLTSLALYNNSLSYERSLSKKTTLLIGYRYMPIVYATTPFLNSKAIDQFQIESIGPVDKLESLAIGNQSYTGEIRFYGGKKAGARGFYLSMYGHYLDMTLDFPYQYETERYIYTIPFKGSLKGFAGGFMIGAQWFIGNRVSFDWHILGGHYGNLNMDFPANANLSTMESSERRGFERVLISDFDLFNGKSNIEANSTDYGVHIQGTIPFIGIRGFGFNLGIAF